MAYFTSITAPRARHLLCLDLVNEELPPEDPQNPARQRLPLDNARSVLAHARESGWRITHVHRRASRGVAARPIKGLEPRPNERLLYRSGVSAFSNRTFRRSVQDDPSELVLLGVALTAACLATVLTAHDWNLSVTVLEDTLQPAPVDSPDIAALQTVSRALAAPFMRIARSDSIVGPRRHLKLVSIA